MAIKKSLVEVTHDDGYGDSLLMHINSAFGGKDMRADKIADPVAPAMQIEGIPDGWELARVGKVKQGEFYVAHNGEPCEWTHSGSGGYSNYVIIRKKEKRYRHFANAAEAYGLWNAVLKYKNPPPEKEGTRMRINLITSQKVGVGLAAYTYEEAFELFECIDGTPFGVEVVE